MYGGRRGRPRSVEGFLPYATNPDTIARVASVRQDWEWPIQAPSPCWKGRETYEGEKSEGWHVGPTYWLIKSTAVNLPHQQKKPLPKSLSSLFALVFEDRGDIIPSFTVERCDSTRSKRWLRQNRLIPILNHSRFRLAWNMNSVGLEFKSWFFRPDLFKSLRLQMIFSLIYFTEELMCIWCAFDQGKLSQYITGSLGKW